MLSATRGSSGSLAGGRHGAEMYRAEEAQRGQPRDPQQQVHGRWHCRHSIVTKHAVYPPKHTWPRQQVDIQLAVAAGHHHPRIVALIVCSRGSKGRAGDGFVRP